MSKESILKQFALFDVSVSGIGNWLGKDTDHRVFDRLDTIDQEPLSKVQLNQLLAFGHEAPVSDEFFRYYWLSVPSRHPYDVSKLLPEFDKSWEESTAIVSLTQLRWGLYRLYVDALLYFGNVGSAYRKLRALTGIELDTFFGKRRFDTSAIKSRGPSLPLLTIPKDDRYLISEMACKSYGEGGDGGVLEAALMGAMRIHLAKGGGSIAVRRLLDPSLLTAEYASRQQELMFSADDVLDEAVASEAELKERYDKLSGRFAKARQMALENTHLYLSMVNDLDIYVATSMRSRQDFRDMAADCEKIFADQRLKALNLRYFDPTLSAANGHEDKGLIECLMVKCAKALVYCAGERESYGKDAEAAMALSLGKPVIFYCNQERRRRFYRDVHPLSRLIEFDTGIAMGAMVTDKISEVTELLWRIFENRMDYELEHTKPGHLRLLEKTTGSVVRLQTSDRMLTETFWNHYHNRDAAL